MSDQTTRALCPYCKDFALSELDVVPGDRPIAGVDEQGVARSWPGETVMAWDEQRPEHRPPRYRCGACDKVCVRVGRRFLKLGTMGEPEVQRTTTFRFSDELGIIEVERTDRGLYVWMNGLLVACLDLYYYGREHKDGSPDETDFPQVTLYQPGEDDPLAHVRWLEGKTEVGFEQPVKVRRRHPFTDVIYQVED